MFVFASPDEPYVVRWEDVKLQLIRVNLGALVRLGEAAPASTPRFTDLRPLSPDRARQLTGTLNWLTDDLLANPEAVAQPLIVGAAARILAGTVLRTFPNGAAAEPVAPHDSDARPAVLRRAMAFIEANAETDVSLGDVAAAARVTPRTVQHAFRRHLETTPGAYLRRVRLDRAHRDLVAADPGRGDTVNAIMVRWGFANPGRFATAYRATYGQSPRDTLTA
jgi:AraC-like DNA-binding protein